MADNERDGNTSFPQPSQAKKPYTAPQLVRWGTMRDITLSSGNHGNDDHAKRGSNRTG